MSKTTRIDEILAGQSLAVPAAAVSLREGSHRERWQDDQALLLERVGFDRKYRGVDAGRAFKDSEAEEKLQAFMANLLGHIEQGAWLYLLGGKGVGKTMAMARIVLAVPLQPLVFVAGEGASGRYTQPKGTLDPDSVSYRFAPDVGYAFGDFAVESTVGPAMHQALHSRMYMADDIHRWHQLGGFVRDNVLAGWDNYTERRDGHGVTVVSANLFADEMDEVPQFKLGLDRARERGLILEIRGESERGQQKTD